MKISVVIVLLTLFTHGNTNLLQDDGFTRIDKALSDRKNQVLKIIPDKKYTYWEFVSNNKEIRTEGKDANYGIKMPKGGFFPECLPSYCYSYVVTVEGKTVKYITTADEFKQFIGEIDNLEEALLIGRLNNLYFDTENPKGGSYKKTEKGFELLLMKYYLCPEKKESIKFTIDFKGNVTTQSKGFYYESTRCIMI